MVTERRSIVALGLGVGEGEKQEGLFPRGVKNVSGVMDISIILTVAMAL